MKSNDVTLWKGQNPAIIPPTETNVDNILSYSRQLHRRDISQLTSSFNSGNYEMTSSYIWQKSIALLKNQLGNLGILFIAEMLDRPDITEFSSIEQKLSDYDAITLSEELGFISGTGALRLRHSYEKLHHFGSLEEDEADEFQMTIDECIGIIRACVDNVVGQERIEAALDFQQFRGSLEEESFEEDSTEIQRLLQSPYFFKRTSIRVLISLIKSTSGAQLENVLVNANLIIPLLWKVLKKPERWQIGRAYADVFVEGKSKAASGLRKALLKVKGFDYVPEDLRSNSYIKVANEILVAHDSMQNYYNEPAPTKLLSEMGSIIPIPALPVCLTAVLSVRLGNSYGNSWAAQSYATSILKKISQDRWGYFLSDCLSSDERILYKLSYKLPIMMWCDLVKEFELMSIAKDNVKDKDIMRLLEESNSGKQENIKAIAMRLINKLGFKTS
ncbi:MAG: hypothetical protein WC291_02820 [Thermodesulfovibrionales bacterium]|jgi:hypothetical protein